MRLGLFGGSFDPVHLGHLAIARAALRQAGLDRLLFLPAARNPFKTNDFRFSPEERLALLQLAVEDYPGLGVSSWELERPPPSYTIDTVRHFAAKSPGAEFFWLIGSDQLEDLPRWKQFGELALMVTFLCAPRPGSALRDTSTKVPGLPPERLKFLEVEPDPASSTEVRRLLKLGTIPEDLLPTRVCQRLRSGTIIPV